MSEDLGRNSLNLVCHFKEEREEMEEKELC